MTKIFIKAMLLLLVTNVGLHAMEPAAAQMSKGTKRVAAELGAGSSSFSGISVAGPQAKRPRLDGGLEGKRETFIEAFDAFICEVNVRANDMKLKLEKTKAAAQEMQQKKAPPCFTDANNVVIKQITQTVERYLKFVTSLEDIKRGLVAQLDQSSADIQDLMQELNQLEAFSQHILQVAEPVVESAKKVEASSHGWCLIQ